MGLCPLWSWLEQHAPEGNAIMVDNEQVIQLIRGSSAVIADAELSADVGVAFGLVASWSQLAAPELLISSM